MKKLILPLFLAAATLVVSAAIPAPAYKWSDIISAPNQTQFNEIINTPDNGTIAVGQFDSKTATEKVSFNGTELVAGAALTGTSKNPNLFITRQKENGELDWYIYSKEGEFPSGTTYIAAAADGGSVVVSKVRATEDNGNKAPVIVDAKGNEITFAAWPDSRVYFMLVLKISKDGVVEWNRVVTMDSAPLTAGGKDNLNAVTPNCLSIDGEGSIWIGGNYRAKMSVPMAVGEKELLPRAVDGYDGDSQKSAGGAFILKLTAEGYYADNVDFSGADAYDEVYAIGVNGTKGYFAGVVNGDAGKNFAAGTKEIKLEETPRGLFCGAFSTADCSVDALTYMKGVVASNNKCDVKIKGIATNENDVYVYGGVAGGLTLASMTTAVASTTSTQLEGFVARLNSACQPQNVVINGTPLGINSSAFFANGMLYAYCYRMVQKQAILNIYQPQSLELDKSVNVAENVNGMTSYGAAFNPTTGNVVMVARGNGTFKFGTADAATPLKTYGTAIYCYNIAAPSAGIADVEAGDKLEIEAVASGLVAKGEGWLNVVTPLGVVVYSGKVSGEVTVALSSGIYIANRTKVAVK